MSLELLKRRPAQARPAPRDGAFLRALALRLQREQRHAEAIPVLFEALALKLDDAYLHYHLGNSFKDLGMKAEAAECVRTAVLLGVGASELAARGQLWFLERESCRWAQAAEVGAALRQSVQALPIGTPAEASPFTHAVLVDDPAEVLKVARHHALHVQRRAGRTMPRRTPRAHQGRLRVGYLSADFHNHATSLLMADMLESHDRERFEFTLFSSGPDDASPMRRRIEQACENFVDLRGLDSAAMAQRVRARHTDILIDLKGATHDTLLPVLAHCPAPLQATWLGFPGSTGAPFVDYVIGDAVVTPLEMADHYSEKIAQLPGCYQPNDRYRERPAPRPRREWGVPEDGLLLCAFHQPYKISGAVFDTWCQLLLELPRAVLWLLHWNSNVESALRAAAAERGVGQERLCFAPVLPVAQHLARLASADLVLDTWPCNAHTTASEALWMGVPVVSILGQTFAQRVGASLLYSAGVAELVCNDVAGYCAQVHTLAANPAQRAALRLRLDSQRAGSRLFDGKRQARDMEALLQRMWQRGVAGLPPAALAAQPGAPA